MTTADDGGRGAAAGGDGVPTREPAPALPLFARFPGLRRLRRASLGTFPSPVEAVHGLPGADPLWVKRDDLDAPVFGGNKVRALEFLLGAVRPGDLVVTVGGAGSTHVLATAAHAARLGARTVAVRWPHDMHPVARRVEAEAARHCAGVERAWTPVDGMVRGWLRAWRAGGDDHVHFIPLGGSSPLGVLGHVNAALELAGQLRDGLLPPPAQVVVPLGSGGTAAGLALGFAAAGIETTVVGARVGPRVAVTHRRVLRLAEGARQLIEQTTGDACPAVAPARVRVMHEVYGGAYGRPLAGAAATTDAFVAAGGPALDATYSEKALAAAVRVAAQATGPTLFWLTFDARWLGDPERFTPPAPIPTLSASPTGQL